MGIADGPARAGARIAIHQSRTAPYTVIRRVATIDQRTDVTAVVPTSASLRGTPLLQYKTFQIDDNEILRDDAYILIAALDVEDVAFPMLLDSPGGVESVTMIVVDTIQDENFNVRSIDTIYSGDLIAAYRLQLRK